MTGIGLRPARKADSRVIAELFRTSSDGVADYLWSTWQPEYPNLSLLDIGQRRYERESTLFSYQNCVIAEQQGDVRGMMHAFVQPSKEPAAATDAVDPVLRPYSELEAPGSLYISALAVFAPFRGQGFGGRLLEAARDRAGALRIPELSLLCFAGNTGARRLYERSGFVVVDWRPVVPHTMIRHTGDVLLMLAPV